MRTTINRLRFSHLWNSEYSIFVNQIFDAFEYCSDEYDEPDYTTPANELNDLIAYYKTQLKARATRRKAGKDVSKEKPIAESAS